MAAARRGLAGALVKCWKRSNGLAAVRRGVAGGRRSNGFGDGGAVSNSPPAAPSSEGTRRPRGLDGAVAYGLVAALSSRKSFGGGGGDAGAILGLGSISVVFSWLFSDLESLWWWLPLV